MPDSFFWPLTARSRSWAWITYTLPILLPLMAKPTQRSLSFHLKDMWAAFYREISETLIEQCRFKYKRVTVRIAVSSQMSIKQTPHAGTVLAVMRDARDVPSGVLALGSCLTIEYDGLGNRFYIWGALKTQNCVFMDSLQFITPFTKLWISISGRLTSWKKFS